MVKHCIAQGIDQVIDEIFQLSHFALEKAIVPGKFHLAQRLAGKTQSASIAVAIGLAEAEIEFDCAVVVLEAVERHGLLNACSEILQYAAQFE